MRTKLSREDSFESLTDITVTMEKEKKSTESKELDAEYPSHNVHCSCCPNHAPFVDPYESSVLVDTKNPREDFMKHVKPPSKDPFFPPASPVDFTKPYKPLVPPARPDYLYRSPVVVDLKKDDTNRGRSNRSNFVYNSRDSSVSVSPVRYRRRRAHSPIPPTESVSSHQKLIPPQKDTPYVTAAQEDSFVLLEPFNTEVYLTTHAATPEDFRHWLPLLTSAVPEFWYAFSRPDTIHVASPFGSLHNPAPMVLRAHFDAQPAGVRLPSIRATAALRVSTDNLVTKGIGRGFPPALVYFSVQQSTMSNGYGISPRAPAYLNGPVPVGDRSSGQAVYRVMRCGSRDQAAAQAFMVGGEERWSTVFTCVVKDLGGSAPVMRGMGEYERVKTLQEVIDDDGKGEKIKVFY